tara:strand:- start:208 stop:1479 length:1272 start_codon:yes stop_codon:yes gene_type:complete
MKIINTEKSWDKLKRILKTQHFVYLQMLSDVNKHPKQNRVSCFFIQTMTESYIVPVNHSEKFAHIDEVEVESKVCVADMKSYLHNSIVKCDRLFGLVDMNWCHYMKTNEPYDFDKHLTTAHHHNYRLHYDKENVNDVIPLVKHGEYFEKVGKDLLKYLEDVEYYNQGILEVLSDIEKNGLQTTNGMVYTEYNPYTSTGRPSNRFGGMNFAALNKKDGSRKQFISRFEGGVLVEFDYDAYHPRLIGDKIGYKFPNGSAHEHLAETYGLSYDEGKALTFKYLYGGITTEMKQNPFFGMVDEFISGLWSTWKTSKSIKSDIYNREIFKDNLHDMNPNKLFNYMIQLSETENNIAILDGLISTIEDYKSKLVLYNYDAFLFDVDVKGDGLEFLKKVKRILEQDGKYPTKISMGDNYHTMRDITEKFK